MHRLFKTPELVSLICACLNVSYHPWHLSVSDDCAPESTHIRFRKTALVSKQFYFGIMPYHWTHVDLSDLFKRGLIPATLEQSRGKARAYISNSLSLERMSRFRSYAPYIKQLNIYEAKLEVHNWEFLASFCQATELLPNLVELTSSLHDLEVFSIFLSRSTKRITIPGSHCSKYSTRLLEIIKHTCPGLRLLNFHPELHEPANTVTAQNNLLRDFTSLSSFQNLRDLTASPMIIQSPVLELVAQLPCLECLVVYTIYPGAKWDPSRCQQLPPGSFPALESLTAELRSPHDAKRFWELIPLPNLKELELDMGPSTDDNELQFIPTLCRGSPQITSLQLRFRGLEEPHVISSEMFEHLARLPLKETFSLDSAILDFVGAWVRVASAWPHLKTIYCLDQPTNLDHLLLLCSNLPDLKYINCDLDLEDAAQTIECNWRPDGRPAFYSNLAGLTIKQFEVREAMQYNLTEVARFIAYFWPEAEVRSDQEDLLSDSDDNDSDTEREDLLDKQGLFRMFRELIRAYVCLFHDG